MAFFKYVQIKNLHFGDFLLIFIIQIAYIFYFSFKLPINIFNKYESNKNVYMDIAGRKNY